eukprot:Hpha_TRINITY_DN16583_c2_g1::TRINITY_DN16583_c2_g1_i1::g.134807::m.134807
MMAAVGGSLPVAQPRQIQPWARNPQGCDLPPALAKARQKQDLEADDGEDPASYADRLREMGMQKFKEGDRDGALALLKTAQSAFNEQLKDQLKTHMSRDPEKQAQVEAALAQQVQSQAQRAFSKLQNQPAQKLAPSAASRGGYTFKSEAGETQQPSDNDPAIQALRRKLAEDGQSLQTSPRKEARPTAPPLD